jgi:hypothetical protein
MGVEFNEKQARAQINEKADLLLYELKTMQDPHNWGGSRVNRSLGPGGCGLTFLDSVVRARGDKKEKKTHPSLRDLLSFIQCPSWVSATRQVPVQ